MLRAKILILNLIFIGIIPSASAEYNPLGTRLKETIKEASSDYFYIREGRPFNALFKGDEYVNKEQLLTIIDQLSGFNFVNKEDSDLGPLHYTGSESGPYRNLIIADLTPSLARSMLVEKIESGNLPADVAILIKALLAEF